MGQTTFELPQNPLSNRMITELIFLRAEIFGPIKYQEKKGNVLLKQEKYAVAKKFFEQYLNKIKKFQKQFNFDNFQIDSITSEVFKYFNPVLAKINICKALLELKELDQALQYIEDIQKSNDISKELEPELYQLKIKALLDKNLEVEAKQCEQEATQKGLIIQKLFLQREQSAPSQNPEDRGHQLMKQNKYCEARQAFVEALKANPNLQENYFDQCQILLEHNEFIELLKWIEDAIQINPTINKIYKIQTLLKKRMNELIYDKKCQEARSLLDKAYQQQMEMGIQETLKNEDWYFQIGLQLLKDGNYAEADEVFNSHIYYHEQTKDKSYFNAYFLKCLCLLIESLNKFDDAKNVLEQAQKIGLQINDETRPNLIDIFSLRSENVKDIQLPFL